MARILLVQGSTIIHYGLRSLFERQPDMQVVGEAEMISDVLTLAQAQKPDAVLIDGSFQRRTGESVRELVTVLHKNRVRGIFVLVSVADEEEFFHLLREGIAGYETLAIEPSDLLEKIRRIAGGEYVMHSGPFLSSRQPTPAKPSTLKEQLEDQAEKLSGPSHDDPCLSARELEVLRHVQQGYSNKQIAHAMEISDQTVKNHMTAILARLKVADRTAAVMVAVRRGILPLHGDLQLASRKKTRSADSSLAS